MKPSEAETEALELDMRAAVSPGPNTACPVQHVSQHDTGQPCREGPPVTAPAGTILQASSGTQGQESRSGPGFEGPLVLGKYLTDKAPLGGPSSKPTKLALWFSPFRSQSGHREMPVTQRRPFRSKAAAGVGGGQCWLLLTIALRVPASCFEIPTRVCRLVLYVRNQAAGPRTRDEAE